LLRPVHHWTEDRIKAHVFICVLALQIERLMRNRLKTFSVSKALDRLRRIKVGEIKIGNTAKLLATDDGRAEGNLEGIECSSASRCFSMKM